MVAKRVVESDLALPDARMGGMEEADDPSHAADLPEQVVRHRPAEDVVVRGDVERDVLRDGAVDGEDRDARGGRPVDLRLDLCGVDRHQDDGAGPGHDHVLQPAGERAAFAAGVFAVNPSGTAWGWRWGGKCA